MTGTSVIYRYTGGADDWTAGGFSDKIEFDTGIKPDATGSVTSTKTKMTRALNENPKPKSNNPNESQDNGLGQVYVTIYGTITAPNVSLIDAQFLVWMVADQTNTNFPYGRFGIHLVDRPYWNTTPTGGALNGWGFLIEDVEVMKVPGFPKLDFTARLKFNGNQTGLGTGN